jgi:hypothetical protein
MFLEKKLTMLLPPLGRHHRHGLEVAQVLEHDIGHRVTVRDVPETSGRSPSSMCPITWREDLVEHLAATRDGTKSGGR